MTARFGGDDRCIPFAGGDPNEERESTDPLEHQMARRVSNLGGDVGDRESRDGDASGQGDTWNSSEITDRRCLILPEKQVSQQPSLSSSEGLVLQTTHEKLEPPYHPLITARSP